MTRGLLYTRDGVLAASTTQEGLVRRRKDEKPPKGSRFLFFKRYVLKPENAIVAQRLLSLPGQSEALSGRATKGFQTSAGRVDHALDCFSLLATTQ